MILYIIVICVIIPSSSPIWFSAVLLFVTIMHFIFHFLALSRSKMQRKSELRWNPCPWSVFWWRQIRPFWRRYRTAAKPMSRPLWFTPHKKRLKYSACLSTNSPLQQRITSFDCSPKRYAASSKTSFQDWSGTGGCFLQSRANEGAMASHHIKNGHQIVMAEKTDFIA